LEDLGVIKEMKGGLIFAKILKSTMPANCLNLEDFKQKKE